MEWWNVDLSCGHLKMNIAMRDEIYLDESCRAQVLNRFSAQEQLAGRCLVVGIESFIIHKKI